MCARASLRAWIASARRPSIPAALAEELEIVDEVHRIIIGRRSLLEIGEVRSRALTVGFSCFLVTSDALQDVRRHMFQMTGGGHHSFERLGRLHG